VNESWRGYGLLADRAYASLARRRACAAHAVQCVIRLQDNWKPKVDYSARGQVTQACVPGTEVLDQLRGWKRQPMARKEGHSGEVSHGHIKAAA
jgi:hypothetical protein